ncbi:ThaI family type II restriction endonuclease [Candidatus Woesearchaeota archaeon]|nr:ThaI family type II restriction endonuclease [Candidatus Woesearchaeota archaeon]
MVSPVAQLFKKEENIKRVQAKLPYLFQMAELESSRAGKIGMEVGSLRERIIVALLVYVFGENNVDTNLPITNSETDVIVLGHKLSIKTITGNGGVKAVWTVDAKSAQNFIKNYSPQCEILLTKIVWGLEAGGFFLIPLEVQNIILRKLGSNTYLKPPKEGTNPRGVEFSKEALTSMLEHPSTLKIKINWQKSTINFNIYERWIDYWASN